MIDIYDIKEIVLGFPIDIFYTILVCVIFGLVYFLVFRKKNIDDPESSSGWQIEEKEKIDFWKLILEFEEKCLEFESGEFLREISLLFRTYLEEEKWYENFSKLTLQEIIENWEEKLSAFAISGQAWNDIIYILKNIYFKEYREEELTKRQKEKILQGVKNIILEGKS